MKKNIAIVTEKEIVREVLKHYFLKNSFYVTTYHSGVELLECSNKPDSFSTIILDMTLPDITGIDLYDKLRKEDVTVPVIFVSSRNISSELGRRLRKDPLLRYFQKPVDPEEIANEARRLINEKV
jgi:two-component system, OmpR family, alkaline phosphatase synthesis response regulator PhoP